MKKEVFTFLVGGKAGEGVKKAGSVAAHLFASMGRVVFQMDDYQSLIRGGHNFSVISTSAGDITSHYMQANLVVALDARSYQLHQDHLADNGIMVFNSDEVERGKGLGIPLKAQAEKYPRPELRVGVGAVATLAAALGLGTKRMHAVIKEEYPGDIENNIAYASDIYKLAEPAVGGKFALTAGGGKRPILSGNQAIGLGAVAGGLDVYLGYPMTPSSPLLHFLAARAEDFGLTVVHPESEIAVANMAIGAAAAGARAMVGTSGGGFALMDEAFSLAGMTETPLLCVLGSRPGPATGVPTYTEQGDLRFALNKGHGEFPRIVASPGSVEESYFLAAKMLSLVWRFQTPGVLLTEKHLAESKMTVDLKVDKAQWSEPKRHVKGEYKRYLDTEDGISPLLFPPSKGVIKWNSYEHDQAGITTERAEIIVQMHDKRQRKSEAIRAHLKGVKTINEYGENGVLILTYGSTTMSVLEALRAGGIEARVVQPVFLEPLPTWELERYIGRAPVVVEQSRAGQFANLLREKAGIEPRAVIKRYDGRPFDPVELATEIKGVM
jgi:2-oxoglutarate ferredoxin oxidoreductase subunit alpha